MLASRHLGTSGERSLGGWMAAEASGTQQFGGWIRSVERWRIGSDESMLASRHLGTSGERALGGWIAAEASGTQQFGGWIRSVERWMMEIRMRRSSLRVQIRLEGPISVVAPRTQPEKSFQTDHRVVRPARKWLIL